MLASSHSQTFFPSTFQDGISASANPSFELQRQMQFEPSPTPTNLQQYHLQQRLAIEAMQQQHQQTQGFMHQTPTFEQQILMAQAQFELQAQAEAHARAHAQAQALNASFIHPGHLSHTNSFNNEMHDNSMSIMPHFNNVDFNNTERLVFPTMPELSPLATHAGHAMHGPTPETLASIVDEQTGLSFPMENFYRSINPTARQRTAQACEKCRDRKTKCTGTRPTCQRCADRGLNCVWAPDTRVRGLSRTYRSLKTSQDSYNDGSMPGSPVLRSAPATQVSFPLPGKGKRGSWHGVGSTVARGEQALDFIGGPIRSLPGGDDGWDDVGHAVFETPESSAIYVRARSKTVSVAHISRSRDLKKPVQIGPLAIIDPALEQDQDPSTFASSPHSSDSHPETVSECSEPPLLMLEPVSLISSVNESHILAPLPSYDTASQLSDEMKNLLNFARHASDTPSFVGEDTTHKGEDVVTIEDAAAIMSQFLTQEALANSQ